MIIRITPCPTSRDTGHRRDSYSGGLTFLSRPTGRQFGKKKKILVLYPNYSRHVFGTVPLNGAEHISYKSIIIIHIRHRQ